MEMVQEQYADDTRPGFAALYLGRYATGVENLMPGQGAQLMTQFEQTALASPHPVESEIRNVILAGELTPKTLGDRVAYLRDMSREYVTNPDTDVTLIEQIYTGNYTPTDAERAGLIERHGWFGELAASYNLPKTDPQHQSPRTSASIVVFALVVFMLLIILAGFAGLVLAVVGIVLLCNRKLRFRVPSGPAGHRSVYLEMVAIFLVGFILLQLVFGIFQELTGVDLMLPILVLSALPLLWPVLLGVSWNQFKLDMGFNTGQGLIKEIGAGFIGYLAGLPVIAVGIGITFLLSLFAESQADHPLQYELLDGGKYTVLVALFGAVVWAPLVEESVFRSAFYRHLRQWRGIPGYLLATVVTSFVFAAIHPQGWLGIPALMSIAFVLAGLREWRGSIVPSMVAHAIHNGTICLLFGIVLFA